MRRALAHKVMSNVFLLLALASLVVYRTYDPRWSGFAAYFTGCVSGLLVMAAAWERWLAGKS